MSTTRREILISGRDTGLGSLMDRLRRSASELGRELLSESLQNTRSSRDAIRQYEEQIRLIERRNRVHSEGLRQQASSNLETALSRGVPESEARSRYRSTISDINRSSREDQLQVQLLRELIDTVRVTSQQEIRSTESTSESRESLIRTTSQESGEEFGRLQRRILSEDEESRQNINTGGSLSSGISSVTSGINSVGRENSFLGLASTSMSSVGSIGSSMGSSILGKAGIAGMIIAALKSLVDIPLQVLADREKSLSTYSALTGRSVSSLADAGFGNSDEGVYGPLDLNVSKDEYLQKWLPGIMRGRGTASNAERYAFRGMELMRGAGVDEGVIMQASRYGRVGGGDATSMAGQLYNLMKSSGTFGSSGQDFTRMNDLLSTLVSLQEEQLMSSGSVGGNANANLLSRFSTLGGAFGREDYTASTIRALNSGLSQGGVPEAQAVKFDALRRLNPNKSYFELQVEMEKGINSKGYADAMLNMAKSTGGTLDDQMIFFDSLMGGQMRKSDIEKIFKQGMSFSDLESGTGEGGFSGKIKNRALNSSSRAQTMLDFQDEALGDVAKEIGQTITDIADTLKSIKEGIFGGFESVGMTKSEGIQVIAPVIDPVYGTAVSQLLKWKDKMF